MVTYIDVLTTEEMNDLTKKHGELVIDLTAENRVFLRKHSAKQLLNKLLDVQVTLFKDSLSVAEKIEKVEHELDENEAYLSQLTRKIDAYRRFQLNSEELALRVKHQEAIFNDQLKLYEMLLTKRTEINDAMQVLTEQLEIANVLRVNERERIVENFWRA